MARILVVDDEKKMRHLLSIMLGRAGHHVDEADDGMVALQKVQTGSYDMLIADIKMPRMDGMTLLREIKKQEFYPPVVFITAFATVESAVDAMRAGAVDYITKPFEEERILFTVARTLRFSRIVRENRDLRDQLNQHARSEKIVYVSRKMASVMDLACKVAESDSAVLVNGESGTGKELLARFVHRKSRRKKARFVPVNCAAISPNLVESELFGHEKGSFTGAEKRAIGKFEYCSTGTLFMDEIGDLPLEAQAKLLRALQEKKIQRVGGNEEIPVDVRIICATNRDLHRLMKERKFRQDLFFRISVFPLSPPPLRERTEDILPLAEYFIERFCGGRKIMLTSGAVKVLKEYPWPGNVRELANVVERATILATDRGDITIETLSFLRKDMPAASSDGKFHLPPEGVSLEGLQRDLVRQALDACANNQSAAAKLLGLSRAKFRVLLKKGNGLGS
jgi:DNA-binding NtrC family response regulator